jgi:hypothetical protein
LIGSQSSITSTRTSTIWERNVPAQSARDEDGFGCRSTRHPVPEGQADRSLARSAWESAPRKNRSVGYDMIGRSSRERLGRNTNPTPRAPSSLAACHTNLPIVLVLVLVIDPLVVGPKFSVAAFVHGRFSDGARPLIGSQSSITSTTTSTSTIGGTKRESDRYRVHQAHSWRVIRIFQSFSFSFSCSLSIPCLGAKA